MFRQIILLISIIVAANALRFSYTQGIREAGETDLITSTAQSFSSGYPDVPESLSIGLRFHHNVYTQVTYVTYEITEGFDQIEDFGLADVRFTNFNTTSLNVRQVIYGFDLGPDAGAEKVPYTNSIY